MLHLDNDTLALEHAGKLTRYELEELYALKACQGRPNIVTNVMVFEKLCLALSGSIPNMEAVEKPDAEEAFVAIHKLLQNKIITQVADLGESVLKYVAILCIEDGWAILPPYLDAVQQYLNFMLPDQCHEMFTTVNWEWLTKTKPWDDENVVSLACAKAQAVVHLLSTVE